MLGQAKQIQEQIIAWRRAIHRHPELGFDLIQTAALVSSALSAMGYHVQNGIGKTGVVAHLGSNGPVIAIRADMDALPIQEANSVDYASQIPGCMHACGHDAHTAMLLGAAVLLSKESFPGQVRLIFQPSEEAFDADGFSGAPRMIADGALVGADVVIALHVDPSLDTGMMMVEDGPISAAVDTFKTYVVGKGGHGAYPHQVVDPIWLSSQVLNALYAIPSRQVPPMEPSVVSVGVLRGGSAENIIPDEVYLEGTLRSYAEQVREALIREVERALRITHLYGGDYRLEIQRGYPVGMNDPQVARWMREVGVDFLGDGQVGSQQKTMGAEDFSYMTQIARGAMASLGVKTPGRESLYLHTSTFDLDEEALPIGSAILAETARRFLRQELT
jgi:amidohydrolase